ncbi:winged helix-turn-helix transcriptional regulator [Oribacterium sp. oral taxon 108]|uniref:winged helix-turn-helix transcriptional regulator n=1 Tax=Oribacterium sp. oral taxon 108 TaxID=712414 RepID=UPI00020DDC2B|nr:winged helix-turn-helix transcriptional regulator [Oribacterium sp. oral taxon 108]EGL38256.1 HTH domain protein [Oribacterium sp. oral taxon 108 str. F0425]
MEGREKQIFELLYENPSLTRVEMAKRIGCSESTVKRALQKLMDKGAIKRIGSNKKGEWIIV